MTPLHPSSPGALAGPPPHIRPPPSPLSPWEAAWASSPMTWSRSPLPIRSASTLPMSALVLTPPPSPLALPPAELMQSQPSTAAPLDCPTPCSLVLPLPMAATMLQANRWSAAQPAATPSSLRASSLPPSTALPPSTRRRTPQPAPSHASRPQRTTAPMSSLPSSTPCALHALVGMPHARGNARLALVAWRTVARAATCLTHPRVTTMLAPMSLACGMGSRATNSLAVSPAIRMPSRLPLLHQTWSCPYRLWVLPHPPLPRPRLPRSCGLLVPPGLPRHTSSVPPRATRPPPEPVSVLVPVPVLSWTSKTMAWTVRATGTSAALPACGTLRVHAYRSASGAGHRPPLMQ